MKIYKKIKFRDKNEIVIKIVVVIVNKKFEVIFTPTNIWFYLTDIYLIFVIIRIPP